MSSTPSRRFVLPDPGALADAYRWLAELSWVEGCSFDVGERSLRVSLSPRLADHPLEAERRFRALERRLVA